MPRIMPIIIALALGIALGACVGFDRETEDAQLDHRENDTGAPDEPDRPALARRDEKPQSAPAEVREDGDETHSPVELMPRVDSQASLRLGGTLVDEFGQVFADTSLRWRVRFGPQLLDGYTRTSAEGRFGITLRGGLQADEIGRLELEPGRPIHGLRMTPPPMRRAAAFLPEVLPRGEIDLGRLQFGALPLACSGRVVDRDGQPMPGAEVWAWVKRAGNPSPMGYMLEVGADGSFELRLPGKPESIELRAARNGMLPAVRTGLDPGSEGIELRLDEAAALSGRIEGTLVGARFELIDAAGRRHDAPTRWQPREGPTRFEFRELAPGPAHLRIERNGTALIDRSLQLAPGHNALLN